MTWSTRQSWETLSPRGQTQSKHLFTGDKQHHLWHAGQTSDTVLGFTHTEVSLSPQWPKEAGLENDIHFRDNETEDRKSR